MLRVGSAVRLTLDCLFPQSCIGCGRPGSYFCARCETQLPWIFPPLCPRCGRPQASAILCPVCAQTASALSVIRSPLRFEGAARRAIHELKYHNLRAIAPTLAAYLVRTLQDTGYEPDIIVPVPLHSRRARRRGYNQSLLLAREVGRETCTPVSADALSRVREGTSQVHTANVEERRQNVSGAFVCSSDASVSGRRILVIDDVCTTGATLESCAVTLRRAGAIDVQGLTVAREV